jgi:hypothetical protein
VEKSSDPTIELSFLAVCELEVVAHA